MGAWPEQGRSSQRSLGKMKIRREEMSNRDRGAVYKEEKTDRVELGRAARPRRREGELVSLGQSIAPHAPLRATEPIRESARRKTLRNLRTANVALSHAADECVRHGPSLRCRRVRGREQSGMRQHRN